MRVLLPLVFFVGCAPDPSVDPMGDPDADGLTNQEEAELGTNPDSADSDGDSFNDKEEIDGGYSALWMYSHPFEAGDYLIGNCPVHPDEANAGPTGSNQFNGDDAYQVGDTLNGWTGTDSFGQEVGYYNFCGNYMLVTVSAVWCGPCQALAAELAEVERKVRTDYPNFVAFELLYQDMSYETPTKRVLADWRDTFVLDGVPVVGPEDQAESEVAYTEVDGYIPTSFVVAPDMRIISMDQMITAPKDLKALIAADMAAQ